MIHVRQNPWTPEDDDLLRKLARSGESAPTIAKRLNRSVDSVRARARTLNIALAKSQILKGLGRGAKGR